MNRRSDRPDVSVVVPSYNSADWLPTTLGALWEALGETAWTAEVIVVDDGSTDSSAELLSDLATRSPHELRVVLQENKGVFLAVWEGLQTARAQWVLILNSRLLLHRGSLAHLERQDALAGPHAWNGHVVTDPQAPLVGRFWEALTGVFWSSYLAHPRPMLITSESFDRVPKGTGCLLVQRELMTRAYRECWPSENARFTSDDTKLLRFVVGVEPIRLDPGFSATYRPRTTVRKFLSHARNRGTLFVDSYAGTSALLSIALVALVVAPPLALLAVIAAAIGQAWAVVWAILAAGVVALAVPALLALTRRVPYRAVLSYLVYVVPFGVVFWRGLAKGLVIHRSAFTRARRAGTKVPAR